MPVNAGLLDVNDLATCGLCSSIESDGDSKGGGEEGGVVASRASSEYCIGSLEDEKSCKSLGCVANFLAMFSKSFRACS